MLYGKSDGSDLKAAVDDMTRFDALQSWTSDQVSVSHRMRPALGVADYSCSFFFQWAALLRTWFIDNPRNVVIGKPSKELVAKLKADTKALEETRKRQLGPAGLKHLEDVLEGAKAENDRDIPPEMLTSFKVPNVDSIKWITVGTGINEVAASKLITASAPRDPSSRTIDSQVQQHIENDASPLPFFVQWDHVKSAFATVTLLFNTKHIPSHLRGHLNLYLSAFFSLPVTRADGTKLPYEAVVKGLDEDTLGYEMGLGAGSGFAELLTIELKVESKNYAKAIAWLRDLIWGAELSVERLRVTAAKLLQSLPEQKRDGRAISWALSRSLTHSRDLSTNVANSVLSSLDTIPALAERLGAVEGKPSEPQSVVQELDEVRQALFRPELMRAR